MNSFKFSENTGELVISGDFNVRIGDMNDIHALFAVDVVDVSNILSRSQQEGVRWTRLLYGTKTDSDRV